MRLKTVALAGALGPTAMGCNLAYYATQTLVNEPLVVSNQVCITHDLRKQAGVVWKEVRAQYPRRAFTAEFRDGFSDGYVDYLDRGGNGSIPATPPVKYTRHKKYFTENGQCLVKDYFLGFKYGQEIAIATGKRQFLTVPVLLPEVVTGPPAFKIEPRPGSGALHAPMPVPTPPPAPGTTSTQFPTPQSAGAGANLNPLSRPATVDTVPVQIPPLPTVPDATGRVGSAVTPAPAAPPPVETPVVAMPLPKLPAPPPEVPEFPAYIPTPPVTDDLPVVQPNTAELPVVPPSHPEAAGK